MLMVRMRIFLVLYTVYAYKGPEKTIIKTGLGCEKNKNTLFFGSG